MRNVFALAPLACTLGAVFVVAFIFMRDVLHDVETQVCDTYIPKMAAAFLGEVLQQ